MPGSMPRRFDYSQTAYFIALSQNPGHWMSRAEEMTGKTVNGEPGLRHQILEAPSFLGFSIPFPAEQRDLESLTYSVAASLVIRVGMGEGMG